MLMDVSRKCFGYFYTMQISPIQRALETIAGISTRPTTLAKADEDLSDVAKEIKPAGPAPSRSEIPQLIQAPKVSETTPRRTGVSRKKPRFAEDEGGIETYSEREGRERDLRIEEPLPDRPSTKSPSKTKPSEKEETAEEEPATDEGSDSQEEGDDDEITLPTTYGGATVGTGGSGDDGDDDDDDDDHADDDADDDDDDVAPVADFTAVPTAGEFPLTVNFTDASTGTITDYSWDFGDSILSPAQNPSHVYNAAGTYTVTLTVTGPGGSHSETKVDHITVSAPAPVADFTADVTRGDKPLTVNFTDLSFQYGGSITSRTWIFEDKEKVGGGGGCLYRRPPRIVPTTYTSIEQNPTHVYKFDGTFKVTLTVTGTGGSDTEEKIGYITVTSSQVPAAEFTADVTAGDAPLTVSFTDASTGSITDWSWDFGDTATSTEQNPSHTYNAAGTYTVSLTATGALGSDTETKAGYITVSSPPSPPDTPPVVSITSPEDKTGVDMDFVTVSGDVSDDNLLRVEIRVDGTYEANALVEGSEFSLDNIYIPDPVDGSLVEIEAKAIDGSGNEVASTVSIIKGHILFIDLLRCYGSDEYKVDELDITSIAVARDILDHMRPDEYGMPLAGDIYDYAHPLNEDASLIELDAQGMKAALSEFDIYAGDPALGYDIDIYSIVGIENYSEYLKEIIRHMARPVDGSDTLRDSHTPVALPLYGDYTQWVAVNGFATDVSPYKDNNEPWNDPDNAVEVTIYGLFLTDPDPSGMGKDEYVPFPSLIGYLLPLPSGEYILVTDK